MSGPVVSLADAKRREPPDAGGLGVPLVRPDDAPGKFPANALGPLRNVVQGIADVTQAPLALGANSALAVASLAVQGLADVEAPGGGRAPLSLFLLTIAASGERKSAADRRAMEGVERFERALAMGYPDELQRWQRAHSLYEARRKGLLKAAEKGEPDAAAELEAMGPEPRPPLQPTITSSAPTLEGVTRNLGVLRPSLGIFSDEGGAFLGGHSLRAEQRMAAAAELSSLWDGRTVSRWRAGDGVSVYRGRRLACHLMVQPVVAASLLGDALAIGQGLLGRFLMCAPESRQGSRDYGHVPDASSFAAIEAFAERVRATLARPLPLRDGSDNELEPRCLPLSFDARRALREFGNEVEAGLRPDGHLRPVSGAANKMPEQACRIAGVMTLIRNPDAAEVDADTMCDAINIASFYLAEAVRLTGAAPVAQEVAEAEALRQWLAERFEGDFVTVRDVARRGPNCIRDAEKARAALGALARNGCLTACDGPVAVNGRTCREAWRLNR